MGSRTRPQSPVALLCLLSYCTPSRAGEHEVRIEAHADKDSGSITYKFNGDGFGPNCDPNTPPDFSLAAPSQPLADEGGGGKASASGSVNVKGSLKVK